MNTSGCVGVNRAITAEERRERMLGVNQDHLVKHRISHSTASHHTFTIPRCPSCPLISCVYLCGRSIWRVDPAQSLEIRSYTRSRLAGHMQRALETGFIVPLYVYIPGLLTSPKIVILLSLPPVIFFIIIET